MTTPQSAGPAIEFDHVSFALNGRPLLQDLTLSVNHGETLVLLGRSGSGKTTTLKLINGLRLPTHGKVRVGGQATTEWDLIRLRRGIGYVIQDGGLFPHFTVERNIALVPRSRAGTKNTSKPACASCSPWSGWTRICPHAIPVSSPEASVSV